MDSQKLEFYKSKIKLEGQMPTQCEYFVYRCRMKSNHHVCVLFPSSLSSVPKVTPEKAMDGSDPFEFKESDSRMHRRTAMRIKQSPMKRVSPYKSLRFSSSASFMKSGPMHIPMRRMTPKKRDRQPGKLSREWSPSPEKEWMIPTDSKQNDRFVERNPKVGSEKMQGTIPSDEVDPKLWNQVSDEEKKYIKLDEGLLSNLPESVANRAKAVKEIYAAYQKMQMNMDFSTGDDRWQKNVDETLAETNELEGITRLTDHEVDDTTKTLGVAKMR